MSHPRAAIAAFVLVLLPVLAACAPQQGDEASSPASAAPASAAAAPSSGPAGSEAAAESAEPSDASETPYEYEY